MESVERAVQESVPPRLAAGAPAPHPRAGRRDRGERRWRRAVLALAALPPLALLAAEGYLFGDLRGFPLDDSWIHLQFARALADGDGLAYDAGRLVAGSTAPLWTALVSVLFLLPGSVEAWSKLAGIAAQVAAVGAAFGVGRRLDLSPRRAALAAGLVAVTDWLVWSSISGMEVPLFVLLTLGGLARHLDERRAADAGASAPPVAFLLFGLAALARPEGLLLPLLAAIDLVVRGRPDGRGFELSTAHLRRALVGLGVAAAVVVPVGLAFLAMSGSPLPTTLAAKSSGPPGFVPELRFLRAIFGLVFPSQPLAALLAAGGALELVRRCGTLRDRGLLLPAWTFGLPVAAAMLSSGQDLLVGNFGRYFFPLLPPIVLLAIVALERLTLERVRWLSVGRLALPVGFLALLGLVGPPVARTVRAGAHYAQARANVEASDEAAADWLAANVPPDARLALCDVGVVKYRLPNPIVDLGGIVSPERNDFLERAARERGLPWPNALRLWLEEQRPEYVVVYPRWFPLLDAEPARFPALHRFRIPNNIAMAGEELVVYSTPWTRSR
jgi:hypothetical protein